MADGDFTTLVSKDKAANAVANPIWVELTDGTTALSVTGGALDVNVDNTVAVSIAATVNVDIQDSWAGLTGGGTESGALRVTIANDSTGLLSVDDNGGSLTVDFLAQLVDDTGFTPETSYVTAAGFFADETAPDSVTEGDIGAARMTLDRKQLMVVVDKTTDANRLVVNSDGSLNVNQVTAALADEYHNYDTTVDVGAGASDTHTVTAAGGVMLVTSVIASASGRMKFEIKNDGATVAVGFIPGGAGGDVRQLEFNPAIEVADTKALTVVRTNRQLTSMDVYSTVMGRQL